MRTDSFFLEIRKFPMICAILVVSSAGLCFSVALAAPGVGPPRPTGSLKFDRQAAEQQSNSIFTRAQALRGEAVYDAHCASCHGTKLEGTPASALTGERFLSKWADGKHTVDDLYYITRTQMPYGAAGKLTKQQYLDVVAFMLSKNGYRPGDQDLPAEPDVLQKLIIKPNDSSQEKTANKGELE